MSMVVSKNQPELIPEKFDSVEIKILRLKVMLLLGNGLIEKEKGANGKKRGQRRPIHIFGEFDKGVNHTVLSGGLYGVY